MGEKKKIPPIRRIAPIINVNKAEYWLKKDPIRLSLAPQECCGNPIMNEETVLIINEQLQIPLDELQFRFSKSSGPGGQHVNKAETRVTLLFDVANSPSLTEEQKALLLEKLQNRLDKSGTLQVSVQTFRSQSRNRDTAVARLQKLLKKALTPPKKRKRTKPSKAAKEKRLAEKKRRSQLKVERRKKW